MTFRIEGFVSVENAIVSHVSGRVHLERVNTLRNMCVSTTSIEKITRELENK
jgi:hypothetical protein